MALHQSADQVRQRVCGDKVRHGGPSQARIHARRLTRESSAPYSVYRCPFCHTWHVGHVPSMEALEALARVIRGLDPNPPEPHEEPSMPARPRRRCTGDPTCPNPAELGGKCSEHARAADASRNRRRATSLAVYRSKRWRRLRRQVLHEQPYCARPGCDAPSTDVDHVVRIEDGGDKWARSNLEGLCHPHHSEKTARETGFGGSHD